MQTLTPVIVLGMLGACAMGEAGEGRADGMARQSPRGGDCFNARNLSGFTPEGDRAVIVRVGANRQYRLSLAGFCPDVDWSHRVALRSRAGSNWICAGGDAEILVPSNTGPQSCMVTAVSRLTPEEIEARRRR